MYITDDFREVLIPGEEESLDQLPKNRMLSSLAQEIRQVIMAAGIVLDPESTTQLLTAIETIANKKIQVLEEQWDKETREASKAIEEKRVQREVERKALEFRLRELETRLREQQQSVAQEAATLTSEWREKRHELESRLKTLEATFNNC